MLTDRFSEAVALAVRAYEGQVNPASAKAPSAHILFWWNPGSLGGRGLLGRRVPVNQGRRAYPRHACPAHRVASSRLGFAKWCGFVGAGWNRLK